MTTETAPYEIKASDNVSFVAKYEDEPVNATYSASYWTWDAHSGADVQTGSAGEDGEFSVSFTQGGLWLVSASYAIPGAGEWTATYDSAGHYKVETSSPTTPPATPRPSRSGSSSAAPSLFFLEVRRGRRLISVIFDIIGYY